ncbi:hypothetical protein [Pseudomonas syringae]|uniref:Methionine aminopeptidase n=1 Tax=Pseudomonas syringae pv. actinidiae TaxID=103796 RepID=A0A2V0QFG3_PSESF|nr:hypothetical protein [Pseudomonas syringae]BBI43270.1 hypothetical protein KPSA1B_101996 [Pseudomonas syringae pv. actinidiae]GBH11517.1 Methionine aminopeptidase [Pseudomonas syringae pv. actinidiae]
MTGDKKVCSPEALSELPAPVETAMTVDFGVVVDGYLFNAARVGNVYTASLYFDHAQTIANGSTVVTPPCEEVFCVKGFKLVRSLNGADHYVIVTEYGVA